MRASIDRMRNRDVLERIDGHLERIDGRLGELVQLSRSQHEVHMREHRENRTAIYQVRDSIRAMTAQIDANTRTLERLADQVADMRDEGRAHREGFMRLIDELRRYGLGGPDPA